MGTKSLISVLFLALSIAVFSQEKSNYQQVDEESYRLYEEQSWDLLITLGESAIDNGVDYYYLRMRLGIAYYELGKYLYAADHFKKASEQNDLEPAPLEYLYYCYYYTGRHHLAEEVYPKLPAGLKEKIDTTAVTQKFAVYAELGPMFHSAEKRLESLDLDGKENIYGEIRYPTSGVYTNLAFNFSKYKGVGALFAMTYLVSDKRHQIMVSDSLIVDEPVRQRQYQVYFQLPVYLNKGIHLKPWVHLLRLNFSRTNSQYDGENYDLIQSDYQIDDFITGLTLSKEYGVLNFDLWGAYSTLDRDTQFQYGIALLAFPFGNVNFYSRSSFIGHTYSGKHHLVFEQEFGFKLMRKVWAEVYGTFGPVKNYYHRNGYVIYNTGDVIRLISGVKLNWYLNESLTLVLDYKSLWREDVLLRYAYRSNAQAAVPVYENFNYFSHLILASILWKF